jgi:hypothetical protein
MHADVYKSLVSMADVLDELVPGCLNSTGWYLPGTPWHPITCPFCQDTNMSAGYTDDAYNCFQCGTAGDIFDIVMRELGCDFRAACLWLSETFGLDEPEDDPLLGAVEQTTLGDGEGATVRHADDPQDGPVQLTLFGDNGS